MNKYIRMMIEVPTGILKMSMIKLFHGTSVKVPLISAVSPSAEITVDRKAKVSIGSQFRQRSGSHIRIRKGAKLKIGNNVSVNHGCMIVSHENITIGNDVQFSPNVMIYDHDHDYSVDGGVKSMKYKCAPISIGNNVWIGANSVILRGSSIGDGVVIGAGSVVKGSIPAKTIYIQKGRIELRQVEE